MNRGSGNVFADLGLPDAEDELITARTVVELRNLVEARGLSRTAAAKLMGLAQPDVSKLLRGRLDGFSLGRLLSFVRALGSDVEITLKPAHSGRGGHIRLLVA